jgi:hypothetical protein
MVTEEPLTAVAAVQVCQMALTIGKLSIVVFRGKIDGAFEGLGASGR